MTLGKLLYLSESLERDENHHTSHVVPALKMSTVRNDRWPKSICTKNEYNPRNVYKVHSQKKRVPGSTTGGFPEEVML